MSIPPKLAKEAERLAKSRHMTRSELFREALRQCIRDARIELAIEIADKERREGKLKVLPPGKSDEALGRLDICDVS